jgi:hypothetical protein
MKTRKNDLYFTPPLSLQAEFASVVARSSRSHSPQSGSGNSCGIFPPHTAGPSGFPVSGIP